MTRVHSSESFHPRMLRATESGPTPISRPSRSIQPTSAVLISSSSCPRSVTSRRVSFVLSLFVCRMTCCARSRSRALTARPRMTPITRPRPTTEPRPTTPSRAPALQRQWMSALARNRSAIARLRCHPATLPAPVQDPEVVPLHTREVLHLQHWVLCLRKVLASDSIRGLLSFFNFLIKFWVTLRGPYANKVSRSLLMVPFSLLASEFTRFLT